MYTTAGGEQPDQLMQVMLPLIDNEICNQPGWYNNSLDDSMVCAGYEQGRLGNCNVSFFPDCNHYLHPNCMYQKYMWYTDNPHIVKRGRSVFFSKDLI